MSDFKDEQYVDICPEIQDIMEMIKNYNTANPGACFVYHFLNFRKDPDHICDDCGENCDIPDFPKSAIGALGDLGTLRGMVNDLRDLVEDNIDEDGIVNTSLPDEE